MSITARTQKLRRELKAMRRTNLRSLPDAQLRAKFEVSIKRDDKELRKRVSAELKRRYQEGHSRAHGNRASGGPGSNPGRSTKQSKEAV